MRLVPDAPWLRPSGKCAHTLSSVDKLPGSTADAGAHTLDLLTPPPGPSLRLLVEVRSQRTYFSADVLALFQVSSCQSLVSAGVGSQQGRPPSSPALAEAGG